ncbi:MAG: ECF transporter S component, partial [Thermoleophilia bacterium]|nr:ECF transporter S component [Thermoleophilia bacterium]
MQGRDVRGNVKTLSLMGMTTALVTVATLYLKIPGPTGFYHMGDGLIYSAALAFGPLVAVPAAAVGSALADVLGGYAVWAPWSLVIKGVTAWLVSFLGARRENAPCGKTQKAWPGILTDGHRAKMILAMLAGAAVTVIGYSIATLVMWDARAALVELLGNVLQTVTGVIIGVFLTPILKRV